MESQIRFNNRSIENIPENPKLTWFCIGVPPGPKPAPIDFKPPVTNKNQYCIVIIHARNRKY